MTWKPEEPLFLSRGSGLTSATLKEATADDAASETPLFVLGHADTPTVLGITPSGRPLSRTELADSLRLFFVDPTEEQESVTVATELESLIRQYVNKLQDAWPEAQVYKALAPRRAGSVDLLVLGTEWKAGLEDAAYDLMFMPESDAADVRIDVEVYFTERCSPDLRGWVCVS